MNNPAQSVYRPEIDGLRALAVVGVIINHVNKGVLPSGYLGVDIFFVISGYVITSSLFSRVSSGLGEFLRDFYARRFKRLLPALLVFVFLIYIPTCLFIPDPTLALGTAKASLVGLSNLYLLHQATDYFAQSSELNPFMHTWSLGVEEQFYLLFPFLVWFSGVSSQSTLRAGRRLVLMMVPLSAISLFLFIYLYASNQPAAYFLMPARFWEMAAGCLVFVACRNNQKINPILGHWPQSLSLVALAGLMLLPMHAAVPATIVVVFLTAALLASLTSKSLAFRVLTHNASRFIGLISYSLYLWHWGFLSLGRWTIGISWWSIPLLLFFAFAFAVLSWKFVEGPFRKAKHVTGFNVILAGLLSIAAGFVAIKYGSDPSFVAKLSLVKGKTGELDQGRLRQRNNIRPISNIKDSNCNIAAEKLSPAAIRNSLNHCYWSPKGRGSDSPVLVFIGDSHAMQIFPVADRLAVEFRIPVYTHAYWGCLVPQAAARPEKPECKNINLVPQWIAEAIKRPLIFVVASIADPIYQFPSAEAQRKRVEDFRQAFASLLDQGHFLIVVSPNPKFLDFDNTQSDICGLGPWSKLNPSCRKDYTFPATEQRRARAVYLEGIKQWSVESDRVKIVDPYWLLCGEKRGLCHSREEGISKYWDPSHLNPGPVMSTYSLYRAAMVEILRPAIP